MYPLQFILQRLSPLTLLLVATVVVLVGHGYEHFFFDGPYRTFFWDRSYFGWWVESIQGRTWNNWLTDTSTDAFIQQWIKGTGIVFFLSAILAIIMHRTPKFAWLLWPSICLLAFLFWLMWKDKFYSYVLLIEQSIQLATPILFYLLLRGKTAKKTFVLILQVVIALTFVGHGLFALNVFPRPGEFVQMTMDILHCSETTAVYFLQFAGFMDLLIAVFLFIPSRLRYYFIWYAVFWGIATAVARPWSHFYLDFWQDSLHRWVPLMLYRLPHGILPLCLLIWLYAPKKPYLD